MLRKGLNLDFVFKVACVLAIGGAIVWSSLPAHSLSRGVRPVGSRGRMMPDFSLPDLDGKGAWKLSEHRGEVVLVNFWATWCPPCRAEMPGLARVSLELAAQRFTIAGIAMDEEGAAIVRPFAAAHPIPYPVLLPPADFPMGNGIESLPTSFLVDKRGRIAKAYVGEISETVLKRDVSALLGETD
jgi:cytochrome c biogenesis protein CcmG/thiol:disulfide interchange protein DsbE